MSERYASLVELARRERDLVDAGRYDDAAAIGEEWRALVATLPSRPPAEARPLLEEAERIVRETVGLIVAARSAAQAELAHLGRGRRALSSYGAAEAAAAFDSRG
jgi:hypothetical protein